MRVVALIGGGLSVLLALSVTGSGCQSESGKPAVTILPQALVEPTLAQQAEYVRQGTSNQIHLIKTKVGDEDLQQLADLSNLKVLLLDNSELTVAGIEQLAELPFLEHLRLRGKPLDDDALQAVAKITSLHILNLPHGDFTDQGIQALANLPQLVQLRLGSDQLTDKALAQMLQFPSLLRIHLLEAPITDTGLKAVQANEQLESLYLDNSQITEQGLRELFAALPGLHVHINQTHADIDPQRDDHPHP